MNLRIMDCLATILFFHNLGNPCRPVELSKPLNGKRFCLSGSFPLGMTNQRSIGKDLLNLKRELGNVSNLRNAGIVVFLNWGF